MRLWQIAATLAPHGEKAAAVLAAEGRFVTTLRLGVRPGAWRAETGENDYLYVTRGVRSRLAALGYLDRRDVGAEDDYLTEQALLAFQGWRISTARARSPARRRSHSSAPRSPSRQRGARTGIEIYRDLGVLLLVEDGRGRARRPRVDGAAGSRPSATSRCIAKVLYLVVGAVPGVDAVRGVLPGRDRDAPVAGRAVPIRRRHGCVRLPRG